MFSVHGSGCCMAQNLGDCYVEKRGKTTRILWVVRWLFHSFWCPFRCFLTLPKWLIFYDFDVSKNSLCQMLFDVWNRREKRFLIAEAEAKKRFFTVEKSLFFFRFFRFFGVGKCLLVAFFELSEFSSYYDWAALNNDFLANSDVFLAMPQVCWS